MVIAGRDMDRDELWQNASTADSSYHAFMTLPEESARRRAFDELSRKTAGSVQQVLSYGTQGSEPGQMSHDQNHQNIYMIRLK